MDQIFLGNPLSIWLRALIAFLVVTFLLEILVAIYRKQASKHEKRLLIVSLISQLKWFTRIALPLWAAAAFLTLPAKLIGVFRVLLIATLAIQAGAWVEEFIKMIANRELDRVSEEDATKRSSISAIAIAARVLLWVILILVILQSIPNFDIVSIITGIGLGGIAIGLAAQSFVKEILSSLTIHLDKPFEVGDSIQFKTFSGTVQKIGLRSTTLRNISGEALSISNSTLLAEPLQNFSRMQTRFVSFSILLAPDSSPEKLRALPILIEESLNQIENVAFNRCRLKGFNPASLDLETAYTVTTPEFSDFVKASHAVNLAVLDLLNQHEIYLASPTVFSA